MKKHILVIEDEINIKDTLSDILELKGYRVTSETDGQAGFFSAIKEKPDLILCDIMMPKMNGFEVLEAVRSYMKTRTIPFIFLTAKDDLDDFREGMDLGADDYLLKPINSAKLYEVIEYRLEKHQNLLEKGQHLENTRVGKDLHDTLQQTLLGLNMQIRKTCELAESERMKKETEKSLEYIQLAISQLRLILEFGEDHSDQDLFGRIEQMTENLKGYIDFQIKLENKTRHEVKGEISRIVFKVMQEIMNNTIKHAKAKNLLIIITEHGSEICIDISDDGVGFDLNAVTHKRGLSNVEERLQKINGSLDICSETGQGTRITIYFEK